jgi:hypothetical protein
MTQTKITREFELHFFRSPTGTEIGPQGELLVFSCKNKADANKTGKIEANKRDWRYLGIFQELVK